MKHSLYLAILVSLILMGCGNKNEFTIKCEIDGLGTGEVSMTYYNGAVSTFTAHGKDGKVTLRGHSPEPALVKVSAPGHGELFSVIAADGDKISVKMNIDHPLEVAVKGNQESAELAEFMTANAEAIVSGENVNAVIEQHVMNNPTRLSSSAIIMAYYDFTENAVKADSLLSLLSAEAKGLTMMRNLNLLISPISKADRSVRHFSFGTGTDGDVSFIASHQSVGLLRFSAETTPDTIASMLRSLRKDYPQNRLAVIDISLAADSATWRYHIRRDSATWTQGWLAGGAGNPAIRNLRVPQLPYIIVADSTGRRLYAGTSLEEADSLIRQTFNP